MRSRVLVLDALALSSRRRAPAPRQAAPRRPRRPRRRAACATASSSRHGASAATVPASAARANASPPARSAGPSPSASSSARSPSPSASRAHACACSGAMPWRPRRSASCAAGSASKRTSWQRERIVGSTSPSRSVSSSRWTNGAGSSSVFSSLFAACSIIVSARSSTNTRRADSNGVIAAAAITGCSTSPTSISCAPLGATHVRSGCAPCSTRVRTPPGSARALGQQRGGERARGGALAAARGAVEEVGVRGPPRRAQAQRRASRGRAGGARCRAGRPSAATIPPAAPVSSPPWHARPADHDRGARRGRQDDARGTDSRTRCARAASTRSSRCASRAASPPPSASARS